MKKRKECSEESCTNIIYARKLCKFHYVKSRNKAKKLDFKRTDYENMSISELKKICDHRFRKYLLNKVERNGRNQIYCPLKKKWYDEDQIDVCHWEDRGRTNTRYDEDNCILCSRQSNQWDSQVRVEGHRSKHHKDFSEFLGEQLVGLLGERASEKLRLNKEYYIKKIRSYGD